MIEQEPNPLDGIDLGTFEAPAAPKHTAERVLARIHGGVVPEPVAGGVNRRAIAIGFAAALVAGIAVWAVVRRPQHPLPDGGAVVADRARHLDLGDAVVELDAGADIRWHRAPGELHVEQRAGTATWTTHGDTRLVIDAGAGDKLASVEATGASLRVEVPMNLSDRVVLTSAATSAVVAALTVFVYEGHVKATHAGQTVVVPAGVPYQIAAPPPAPPPAPPVTVATDADVTITAGESVVVHDVEDKTVVAIVLPCTDGDIAIDGATGTFDKRIARVVLDDDHATYTGSCPGTAFKGSLDRVTDDGYSPTGELPGFQLTSPLRSTGWDATIHVAGAAPFAGTVIVDGKRLQLSSPINSSGLSIPSAMRVFGSNVAGPRKTIAVRVEHPAAGIHVFVLRPLHAVFDFDPPVVAPCDPTPFADKGKQSYAQGAYAQALAEFEKAVACRADPNNARLAVLAACKANNDAKARQYFAQVPASQRPLLAGTCVQNHIELATKDSSIVQLQTTPPAAVLVDGVDTGQVTPTEVKVAPGRHKITFKLGEDRYTYPLNVDPGRTYQMSKDFQ